MSNDADHTVDFSQIDALLNAAGRVGVEDILDAFWRSTDDLVARLALQVEANDFAEAVRTAHAIKGSAANVGASSLSSSARTVETFCREENGVAATDALKVLNVAYANTRAMISARIAAA